MVAESRGLVLQHQRVAPRTEWVNSSAGWCCLQVQQGAALFFHDALSQALMAGDVLVAQSGVGGILKPKASSKVSLWFFEFSPQQFVALLSARERRVLLSSQLPSRRIRVFPSGTSISNQFSVIVEKVGRPSSAPDRFQIMELAAAILGEEFLEGDRPGDPDPAPQDHFSEVLARVDPKDLFHMPVHEIAKKCGLSRRHLNRLFQAHLGCSVIDYKIRLRLQKAAELLQNPEAKISNVALECGFGHLGLFSSKFRALYGATPSEWRPKPANGATPIAKAKSAALNPKTVKTVQFTPRSSQLAPAPRTQRAR